MSNLTSFKDKIIKRFSEEITDSVFLMIQHDRELLQEYLDLLEKNKRHVINSQIAKEIKKKFNLENKDLRIKEPKSFLIKSHESFDTK